MYDVVLVTDTQQIAPYAALELDPLLEAFTRHGVSVRFGAWDDPGFDWQHAGLAVLRTTWNYHRHRDAFLAWTKRVPRLLNPPDVVAWNSHKGYLRELDVRGIPVVPTEWLDREVSLAEVLDRRGWKDAVLKPAVSGGAFRTERFQRGHEPQALLGEILTEGEAMLQPYLPSVEVPGERSLIFFDGALSHAVRRKPPLSTGLHGAEPATATNEELALAERVLATQPPLLYARVDLARDEASVLRLMELEIIEPSFFLGCAPGSADRFADAVIARCQVD